VRQGAAERSAPDALGFPVAKSDDHPGPQRITLRSGMRWATCSKMLSPTVTDVSTYPDGLKAQAGRVQARLSTMFYKYGAIFRASLGCHY